MMGFPGCSTYCLMDRPLDEALALLAAETNLVEVLSDSLHTLFVHQEVCDSFDLAYTVHAPTTDINLAAANESMRHASVEVIADLARICDEVGACRLVVHPGFCMEPFLWQASEQALFRSLHDLAALQDEVSVVLAVENMGSWTCCHFRDPALLPVLDDLGLGFVLDVGHAALTGTLETFLTEGRPVHLHLHDNDGVNDLHAACGSGSIDFSAVMAAVPSSATAVVEVLDPRAVRPSLDYLQGKKKRA
ncbi:sugar phosphate isomerase/epimerase [Methanofollis aquaemaris]|uniref:Sugar phosphate isomerase/epimerase n=1 Tax=Methanofollis aquaemaris TaxID=126734 RepID=A0A8A3S4A3_9EURY|nr:sugar phosphate isomerase/epimerase [Methanofollis aquaemaris]QSZ67107.1 sugar phosphate isomerase/epimerase [Methanofollis aquaemaris]